MTERDHSEGWKLVPVEPTPEHFQRYIGEPLMNLHKVAYKRWAADYREIIAAAPQPPAQPSARDSREAVALPLEIVAIGTLTTADAVAKFTDRDCGPSRSAEIVRELRNRNLACWCALDADVLLALAAASPTARPAPTDGDDHAR